MSDPTANRAQRRRAAHKGRTKPWVEMKGHFRGDFACAARQAHFKRDQESKRLDIHGKPGIGFAWVLAYTGGRPCFGHKSRNARGE